LPREVPVELVAQRGRIEFVGLLLAAIPQYLRHDHVRLRTGPLQIEVQPIATWARLVAHVHLALRFNQPSHQHQQLLAHHQLRPQRPRVVHLDRHRKLARVDVAPNLDRFRVGLEQPPE
jgi:hypothetical protein